MSGYLLITLALIVVMTGTGMQYFNSLSNHFIIIQFTLRDLPVVVDPFTASRQLKMSC